MNILHRDAVGLAYTDEGTQTTLPPLLLAHGWGGDHTVFKRQTESLSKLTRVITLDLRGHGSSDAPSQDYSMAAYAEDVAFVIQTLHLDKPVLVGHSMGGNLGLECAAHFPHLLGGLILIDSLLFQTQEAIAGVKPLFDALAGPHWKQAYLSGLRRFNLTIDDGPALEDEFATMPHASQHVLLSSLIDQVLNHDAAAAARACSIPVAFIGSSNCSTDLSLFRQLTPHLMTAQVLGSGHFSPVVVPEQISLMIARFLQIS